MIGGVRFERTDLSIGVVDRVSGELANAADAKQQYHDQQANYTGEGEQAGPGAGGLGDERTAEASTRCP